MKALLAQEKAEIVFLNDGSCTMHVWAEILCLPYSLIPARPEEARKCFCKIIINPNHYHLNHAKGIKEVGFILVFDDP